MKQADPPEWLHRPLGIGDNVTRVFSHSVRWPIEASAPTKVYLVPPGLLEALIEPDDRPAAEGVVVNANHRTGSVMLQFDEPPAAGWTVYFKYLWQPPRLRGCQVHVKHSDGTTEWAPLEDVMDAITRR